MFNNKKAILIGNTLEFLDLYLYIHFATVIAQKFFPAGFEKSLFLQAFSFSQIYLIAPIACLIFAYLGDKHGRKPIILHTALWMAITSVLIIFLPTYETWGENSVILLLILRIIQGIALAGEPTAANLYLMESTSMDRNSPWYNQAPWYVTVMGVTEQVGGVIALLLCYTSLTYLKDYTHGWRVPFACCGTIILFVLYIRTRLAESEDYKKFTSDQQAVNILAHNETGLSFFKKSILFYKKNVFSLFFLFVVYPTVFNLCFLQISPQVVGIDSPPEDLALYNIYVSIGTILLSLLKTYLPLRFNWNLRKTTATYVSVGCICAFLAVWGLENNSSWIFVFVCQILIISLLNFGLVMPGLIKMFPIIARYRLMALSWSLARFSNFFLIVFGTSAIKGVFGLYGSLYMVYALAIPALFAVWYHICYYTVDQIIFMKNSKKANIIHQSIQVMSNKEAMDRIYGTSNFKKSN